MASLEWIPLTEGDHDCLSEGWVKALQDEGSLTRVPVAVEVSEGLGRRVASRRLCRGDPAAHPYGDCVRGGEACECRVDERNGAGVPCQVEARDALRFSGCVSDGSLVVDDRPDRSLLDLPRDTSITQAVCTEVQVAGSRNAVLRDVPEVDVEGDGVVVYELDSLQDVTEEELEAGRGSQGIMVEDVPYGPSVGERDAVDDVVDG